MALGEARVLQDDDPGSYLDGAAGAVQRVAVRRGDPVEHGQSAFTLARLEPGEMPEGRIQILTHRSESTVWQPRWLKHPNGALALTGIVIAVADPEEAAERFARFTGREAARSASGQTIALDRGRVELVTAGAFQRRLPEIPSLP